MSRGAARDRHPVQLLGASLVAVLALALLLANVEVQIEGGAGWAANLPTWRIEDGWLLDLFWGGRPMTGYGCSAIRLRGTYIGPLATGTLIHELGHCLGFEHVTDRDSIMNPHPVANDVWDQSMLQAAGYR